MYAVMLPISRWNDKTVFRALAEAREELENRPQEYQQLLNDLRNHLEEEGLKDPALTVWKGAESLMKHINKVMPISVFENDAAVQPAIGPELDQPGTMSAAEEALHILEESGKTKEDFMEAIVKLLTMRLSEADRYNVGPCEILNKAFDSNAEMGGLNELRSFLVDLTNLHPDPSYDTETYEQLTAQALRKLDDFDGLASSTDDGGSDTDDGGSDTDDGGSDTDDGGSDTDDGGSDTDDGGSDTDDGGSHTDDPIVEPGTTGAAEEGVLQILEESKQTKEDFMQAIKKTLRMRLSKADQEEFGPCTLLDMAFDNCATKGDLDELTPLLEDLINMQCDPSYDTKAYDRLARKADKMLRDIEDLDSDNHRGSDTDDGGSDTHDARAALELLHSPDAGAARRVTVSIRGREAGLYLTTHSKAPLTVTLLNGLTLSDEGLHLTNDGTGTLSMKDIQDVVLRTCEAKLIATHEALERAQYPAKCWEPLAQCLGCSVDEAENAGKNHKITDFLTEMLLGLLGRYAGLPPIEDEDALSKFYRLLNALHLDFAVGGATLDDCVAFSQEGLKKMWQELSHQRAGVEAIQLVGEGAHGSELTRAENAENGLKRKASVEAKDEREKEDEGVSTNKKLVKERGCHGPSLFGNLTAEEPPTASAPLPCNQGSKVQGVEEVVQCSKEGQHGVPAFHAALEMPMLDKQTYEALKQRYCRQGGVRTFIYIAKGQGTLHVMAGFEDDLYLLNQMEGLKGGSHGHGPLPRWFRLTWGITHVPRDFQS